MRQLFCFVKKPLMCLAIGTGRIASLPESARLRGPLYCRSYYVDFAANHRLFRALVDDFVTCTRSANPEDAREGVPGDAL